MVLYVWRLLYEVYFFLLSIRRLWFYHLNRDRTRRAFRMIGGVLLISFDYVVGGVNRRLPIVWILYSHPYGFVNPYLRSRQSDLSLTECISRWTYWWYPSRLPNVIRIVAKQGSGSPRSRCSVSSMKNVVLAHTAIQYRFPHEYWTHSIIHPYQKWHIQPVPTPRSSLSNAPGK